MTRMLLARAAACVLFGAALAAAAPACSTAEPAGPAYGRRVTVTERYGAPSGDERSVTVSATLVPSADGKVLELEDVRVEPSPGGRQLVRKVEALLEDTVLQVADGDTWPKPARSVPEDARPELTRLQLALAVLATARGESGPGPMTHTSWTRTADRVVAGHSRLSRDGDDVRLDVLALVHAEASTGLAFGRFEGALEDGHVLLRGQRHLAGHPSVPVSLEIREELLQAPQPSAAPTSGGAP